MSDENQTEPVVTITEANVPNVEEHYRKLHEKIGALAQKVAQVCDGSSFFVIRGALGHVITQVNMREAGLDLEEADKRIDNLAKSMKEDARGMLPALQEQQQRREYEQQTRIYGE